MNMKKMPLNCEGPSGKSGPKFTAAAKGGDVKTGLAHYEKGVNVDGMYSRPESGTNQLPPLGMDRIK